MDGSYLLDATEIFSEVKSRTREAQIKIAYYLVLFIFYLFCFIKAIIDYEQSSKNY